MGNYTYCLSKGNKHLGLTGFSPLDGDSKPCQQSGEMALTARWAHTHFWCFAVFKGETVGFCVSLEGCLPYSCYLIMEDL